MEEEEGLGDEFSPSRGDGDRPDLVRLPWLGNPDDPVREERPREPPDRHHARDDLADEVFDNRVDLADLANQPNAPPVDPRCRLGVEGGEDFFEVRDIFEINFWWWARVVGGGEK